MLVLDEDGTGLAAKAFDRAWDQAVYEGILDMLDVESGKRLIAAYVLSLFRAGEKDEWRLARGVITQYRHYKSLMQTPAQRSNVRRSSSGAVA